MPLLVTKKKKKNAAGKYGKAGFCLCHSVPVIAGMGCFEPMVDYYYYLLWHASL